MVFRSVSSVLRRSLLAAALLLLLLIAGLASTTKAQTPACGELTLRSKVQSRPKMLIPGTKVSMVITVKNTGATGLRGINVGVTSPVLAGWKAKWGQIEGGSVYWLSQTLKPGQEHQYKYRARICTGWAAGSPAVVGVVASSTPRAALSASVERP